MKVQNTIGRVLCLCLVLASLCASETFAYPQVKRKVYNKALKAHTRMDELYQRDDFYASMTWHATYLSPTFLEAQINEVSRIYDYPPAKKERYADEQYARFSNYTVFFLSFYGYDYKTADLARKDSVWQLKLEVDGRRYDPVKFEQIKRPTPIDIQLYPYINPWSRHYFVFFPKFTDLKPGDLKLLINGPYSDGELTW